MKLYSVTVSPDYEGSCFETVVTYNPMKAIEQFRATRYDFYDNWPYEFENMGQFRSWLEGRGLNLSIGEYEIKDGEACFIAWS